MKIQDGAVTMATMINNKVVLIPSSKFDHAELIGKHYFGIYGEGVEIVSKDTLLIPLPFN